MITPAQHHWSFPSAIDLHQLNIWPICFVLLNTSAIIMWTIKIHGNEKAGYELCLHCNSGGGIA